MSFDRLQEKIDELRNPMVAGLDPSLEHIPPQILERHIEEHGETLWAAAAAVFEFNVVLINALSDIVPAVKLQSAYYETLGAEGIVTLGMTCKYAKSQGMYVIIDGKRNDIGTTVEAYSAAYLGADEIGETEIRPCDADAMTVKAYLGSDGIKPFIDSAEKYDKAVFALVKTSNPSSGEFQDRFIADDETPVQGNQAGESRTSAARTGETRAWESEPSEALPREARIGGRLYTAVGHLMEEISLRTVGKYGFTRVGAVVGATYPEEATYLRDRLKNTFFLVPGYGAQGGSAAEAARAFDKNGRGAIINSSRAIIAAWKKTGGDYADAARDEALRMRDELRREIYDS
jgi:orotidine-5'-phosphate decarboxylase